MRKYALLIPFLLVFFGCHRNNRVSVNASLRADFGFRPGSYWIYRDSASGAIDSVYVDTTLISWDEKGCVKTSGPSTEYETITISLGVWSGNSSDTEKWRLSMTENKLSAGFENNRDIVATHMGMITLFTYPITTGNTTNVNGCIVTADTGTIRGLGSCAPGGEEQYDNVAESAHKSARPSSGLSYNDCFYTSPKVGFVKMVFNHPPNSVYRVLNLVRFHVVK